jgi:putative ABC transport system substrate-binding protein
MRRRHACLWLAGVPALPRAQTSGRTARIGVITWMPQPQAFQQALRAGLREHGWDEGRNLVIEWRAADAAVDRVDALAAELVRLKVEVIVAEFTPAAMAARRATHTIPIVMAPAGDPVATGLVASLARPGGNVTGLSNVAAELAGKRLELLQALVPGLTAVGLLVYGRDPLDRGFVDASRAAAAAIGLALHTAEVPAATAIEAAFAALRQAAVGALVVPGNLPTAPARTAELALRQRLPSIGVIGSYPAAGGLMAYAPDLAEPRRRAAGYVDRLLRGAKAAELPVEQPTRFYLLLNLKTARALGLTLPQNLLLQADEVLQ